jgi:outer membrane immunogenic protein
VRHWLWTTGVAAIVASGSAFAADLDLPTHKAPPALSNSPAAYNWTGFYLGGNLGGAWGSSDAATTTVWSPTGYFDATSIPAIGAVGAQSIHASGFTGGVDGGYNWQAGSLVLGLESDLGYLGLHGGSSASGIYPCCSPEGFTINSSVRSDWLFTARPRVGFANNNWLFFVTGGLAVTDVSARFSFNNSYDTSPESGSLSNTKAGFALGGGVEVGLVGNWTVKAEYLYVDFGRSSTISDNLLLTGGPTPVAEPTNVFTHSADLNASLVRLGVNSRF